MKNKWLMISVLLLMFSPLLLISNGEFLGTDSIAEDAINQIAPDYEPWFSSIYEPASGEIESLLFALQAAIGAGIIGYGIGFYKGRSQKEFANK